MHWPNTIITAFHITSAALAFPSSKRDPEGTLILLDGGRGHTSSLGVRWPTSLRNISTLGTSASVLYEFNTWNLDYIAYGYGLAYDPVGRHLYVATREYGLARTDLDGSNVTTILNDVGAKSTNWFTGLALGKSKVYWSNGYEGLIKRANLDGSGIEVVRNTSQGMDLRYANSSTYNPSYTYPIALAVDEEEEYVYWSTVNNAVSTVIPHGTSIRRAPIVSDAPLSEGGNAEDVEILVQDLQGTGQLQLLEGGKWLYWAESRSLKRLAVPTKVSEPGAVPTEVVVTWDNYGGSSFAVDEQSGRVWLVSGDDYTPAGNLIETDLHGGEAKLLNSNIQEIGAPTGVVYVV